MKKILVVIAILGLLFQYSLINGNSTKISKENAETYSWEIFPGPTSEDLWDLSMLSPTDGWAVGTNGTILHLDGNISEIIPSPVTDDLFAIDMVSPSDGWIIGSGDDYLRWDGKSWNKVTSDIGFFKEDIKMLSSTNGWYVGMAGTIAHWNGVEWSKSSAPYVPHLEGLDMLYSTDGWAVGSSGTGYPGEFLHWNGSSWTGMVADQLYTSDDRLLTVSMVSSSDVWAGGRNGVMFHWDGSNWTHVNFLSSSWIESIDMLSSSNGWAVGLWGQIFHYDGNEWTMADSPLTSGWLKGVEMLSSDQGWAVGYEGKILHYGYDVDVDIRQAGEIIVSGELVEGSQVTLTIPVKNYGNVPTPAIHPYTEGYTGKDQIWRADGAHPTARIIQPGETVNFQVYHDLWYDHAGTWTTYGVYLWDDSSNTYFSPLNANGFDQSLEFEVYVEPTWLLIYYLALDNDLDFYEEFLVDSLEKQNNPNANIAIFVDSDAAPYYIGINSSGRTPLIKLELNTGNPQTLLDFVNWAKTNYGANNIALTIFDHGNAHTGVAKDESSNGDVLNPVELKQVLSSSGKVDVLHIYTCLMANLEAVYQLRNLSDYIVASESLGTINNLKIIFSKYIPNITNSTTDKQLAILMAESYASYYPNETISVLDMSKLNDVANYTSDLADNIRSNWSNIAFVWNVTDSSILQRFDSNGDGEIDNDDLLADLYHFAELLRFDESYEQSANNLIDSLGDFIILNKGNIPEEGILNANGLSIGLPRTKISYYNSDWLDFAAGADWVISPYSIPSEPTEITEELFWGPFISDLVKEFNPDGEDLSSPPPVISLVGSISYPVYLPLLNK